MAVRGEDARVESVPLRTMMHLMVQRRRHAPGKKKKAVASSVNEALSDGLVTFDLERQETEMVKPRAMVKYLGDGGDWSKKRSSLPRISLGPTLLTSLSFKEPPPAKLVADDSSGKFAYISLDGRLINAELATSASSIGGALGVEEARAWEEFVPMQRVLIVAVAAAAAAAAKHRSREEVERLLKTVEKRVRHRHHIVSLCNLVLSCLRTFWTLVTTLWSLLRWSGMLIGRLKLLPALWSQENELVSLRQELSKQRSETASLSVRVSPKTPLKTTNFDGENARVNLEEAWSSSKPQSPAEKDVLLSSPCQSDSCGNSAVRTKEETAKWYVNPMVETSEDFYNISTPERTNSMFSVCNPAVQGSFEWEVLRSSFGTREKRSSSIAFDLTTAQTTVEKSSQQTTLEDDGALHKDHVVMGALCAAVILDLRKRMLSVLDKETAMVMAALNSSSVRDAKSQLESMHLAVASRWNASMVKALAALSLSPSEFDCWLLNEAQGASALNDTSKLEDSILAWRQYLEKNDASEKRSPNKFRSRESGEWLAPLTCPRYIGQNGRRRIGGLKDFSGDTADQLLGGSDKVPVMECQMKKLEHDIVWRDATAEVKGCEDVAELVKQLESKDVEVADMKKSQQALLEAKNKEIEELKDDFKRRDAELDKRLAAVETTKADSADRLAMLEEICREKDSALSNMKQDIQALESKVQKSKVYQSPVSQRGWRYSTSSTPAASSSSGTGPSQKQRFSDRHVPPGAPSIHEHVGRFKERLPSIKGPLPYIHTQRHEELTDDGRSEHGYDQETSHDYSSAPGSTIGDDCSVNSLAFSETEVESRFGGEYCSSGDESRYRGSKDRLHGTKGKTIQKQKSSSSDLRRAVTFTATSGPSLTPTQSSKSFTSGTSGSKGASGGKYSSKPLQRTHSGEIKKPMISPRTSLGTSNLKGLGFVAANHRRAASLDISFRPSPLETSGLPVRTSGCGSPNSHDSSAIKRKRWV